MPDAVMDRLNKRMAEIYGHRWTSAYTRSALDTWARGLSGFSVEQIANGVSACIAGAFAWPPTLPEFRELCLTVPGLPNPDAAWAEAYDLAAKRKLPHECTHQVIWHAYVNSDLDADEETGKKRFIRNYKIASQQYATGGIDSLREIPKALPQKSVVPLTQEEIDARVRYADEKLATIGLGKKRASV